MAAWPARRCCWRPPWAPSSASWLASCPPGKASTEQRELARTIRVSGSILLSTVSNFLDFFKLEAGKPLDVVRREINVQVRS